MYRVLIYISESSNQRSDPHEVQGRTHMEAREGKRPKQADWAEEPVYSLTVLIPVQ